MLFARWRTRRRSQRAMASAQGQFSLGLSCHAERPEQRLSRLASWCRSGRLSEAELELFAWHREDDSPAVTCLILAVLLAQRDELEAALDVMRRCERRHGDADPAVGQMLIALLIQADLLDAARHAALRLRQLHGHDPAVALWLELMEVGELEGQTDGPDLLAEHLASQLIGHFQLIPTLVVAAKHSAASEAKLLRRAVSLAARDVDAAQQSMICEAMTELSLLAGDTDDARRWAHKGLKINPYSAALALALAQIEDDASVGPPATEVLQGAVAEHPAYPDLQAALIRREVADGDHAHARLHLRRWLARQPRHPLGRQLAREIAA